MCNHLMRPHHACIVLLFIIHSSESTLVVAASSRCHPIVLWRGETLALKVATRHHRYPTTCSSNFGLAQRNCSDSWKVIVRFQFRAMGSVPASKQMQLVQCRTSLLRFTYSGMWKWLSTCLVRTRIKFNLSTVAIHSVLCQVLVLRPLSEHRWMVLFS